MIGEVKRVPNKRVRESVGLDVCFDQEISKEVRNRTGLDLTAVRFILDTYREVMTEQLCKGRKVEIRDFGYLCFFLKRSFFSAIIGRSIPDRYYIKLIITPRLRKLVSDSVTLDILPPTDKL